MYAIEAQTKLTPVGGELIARFDAGAEFSATEPPAESRFERELATALEEIVQEPTSERMARQEANDGSTGSPPLPPGEKEPEDTSEHRKSEEKKGAPTVGAAEEGAKSESKLPKARRRLSDTPVAKSVDDLVVAGKKASAKETAKRIKGATDEEVVEGRPAAAERKKDESNKPGNGALRADSGKIPKDNEVGDSAPVQTPTDEDIEDLEVVHEAEPFASIDPATHVAVTERGDKAESDVDVERTEPKAKPSQRQRSVQLGEENGLRAQGDSPTNSDAEGKHDGKTSDRFDRTTPREDTKSAGRKEGAADRGAVAELDVHTERGPSESSIERQNGDTGASRFAPTEGRVPEAGANAQTARASLESLSRQLKGPLPGDIVTNARIVLRNNDSGEVRLSLHPEELGRVRVHLQMQDNVLSGRIVVDNAAVRDIFEQNLHQLVRAFQDSGWETDSIDVSVADGGNGGGADDQQPRSRRPRREIHELVAEQWSSIEERGLVDLMA